MIELIKQFLIFLKDVWRSKTLIWSLSRRDLKSRFSGSFLGIFWAFIQPAITIMVLWFVFELGFKALPVGDFPFILWLSAGMIPFFFFSDAWAGATNSILENDFLVKKMVFRVSVLPIMKIVSSCMIHLFFVVFIICIFSIYGYYPDIYFLQIFYYIFCLIMILTGLSWISSSVMIFFRDIGNVIASGLQILFWATPIFWSLKTFPPKWQTILKLNPLHYIVDGYRQTFIDKIWFWCNWKHMLYFWILTLIILIIGALFFKKLRPHFADVL